MTNRPPEEPDSSELRGFEDARRIMWDHESRARVHERLAITDFLLDERIAAVHVENTSRADRMFLTAFDAHGRYVSADTLFVDDPTQRLDVAPEFDHDFTCFPVTTGSDLAQAIASEDGWVVDMKPVRDYDPLADRRATQRAVFLAHLADLISTGQVRGSLLQGPSGSEDPEEDNEPDEHDEPDAPEDFGAGSA